MSVPAVEPGHTRPRLPRPPLGCLIVVHGQLALLELCLERLGPAVPVVLVDNGAEGDLVTMAARHGARVVGDGTNVGFAAGVNRGLQALAGHDVLILNPDAQLDGRSAELLHRTLQRDGCRTAAVAPALRRPDGSPERSLWPVPTPTAVWWSLFALSPGVAEFLNGAVLLLSAQALAEVGGFDERFFLYCEEADWQVRALNAGWQVRLEPSVVALHHGAGSSRDLGLRERYFHGSAELFVRKWHGVWGWRSFRLASLLVALRRLALARTAPERQLHGNTARLYLRGPARQLPPRTSSGAPR